MGALWGFVAALAVACSSSDVGGVKDDPRAHVGENCTPGSCGGGQCVYLADATGANGKNVCTIGCSADADCGKNFQCGVLPDGTRGCLYACQAYPAWGTDCSTGIPTACKLATNCTSCGCPHEQRCTSDGQCAPLAQVAEGCAQDSDCETRNCSEVVGVCRVEIGTPCTQDNCDLCLTATDGWSYCSRNCREGTNCGSGACLRPGFPTSYAGSDDGLCYPACGARTRPATALASRWIPGRGPDFDAIARMRRAFRKPPEPMGEAWFMGAERFTFDRFAELPGPFLSAPRCELVLRHFRTRLEPLLADFSFDESPEIAEVMSSIDALGQLFDALY